MKEILIVYSDEKNEETSLFSSLSVKDFKCSRSDFERVVTSESNHTGCYPIPLEVEFTVDSYHIKKINPFNGVKYGKDYSVGINGIFTTMQIQSIYCIGDETSIKFIER